MGEQCLLSRGLGSWVRLPPRLGSQVPFRFAMSLEM
jgi:hypothetical protein